MRSRRKSRTSRRSKNRSKRRRQVLKRRSSGKTRSQYRRYGAINKDTKWTDVGNGCNIKQIRAGSDKYKSYGCFVTATKCNKKGWWSELSTEKEGLPTARFFQVLEDGCTEKAPEPQQISEDAFETYMRESPGDKNDIIRRSVQTGPYFKHENGVVVIEPLYEWMNPLDEVRKNSCILSAVVNYGEKSWGGEYLFSFAVAYAREKNMRKMFFQPDENYIPLTVWYMWCKRESLVLKHSKPEYVNKILEGNITDQYGLYPVIRMYFQDKVIELTHNTHTPTFDLKNESKIFPNPNPILSRLSIFEAKKYVQDNWENTIACMPTMDESGLFYFHNGQVAENTFWVTL